MLLATDRWFYFVAGEVKARCGTVLYKNVLYPAISLYDAEEAHKLSIWYVLRWPCMQVDTAPYSFRELVLVRVSRIRITRLYEYMRRTIIRV